MSKVTIVSNDNKSFKVEREVAERSVLISNIISDLADEDDEEFTIPLPNVRSDILEKVLQWAAHHKNDPDPEDENDKRTISDWDRDFLEDDEEILHEIILAANYLNIKKLLDAGCKTVAENLRRKTPEDIRRIFSIEEDLNENGS